MNKFEIRTKLEFEKFQNLNKKETKKKNERKKRKEKGKRKNKKTKKKEKKKKQQLGRSVGARRGLRAGPMERAGVRGASTPCRLRRQIAFAFLRPRSVDTTNLVWAEVKLLVPLVKVHA